jgi:hypothetical protein
MPSEDQDSPVDQDFLPSPPPLNSPYATVPGLFARRSINLIVGDSKTGRMRLALTNLNTYADPQTPIFLDYAVSFPYRLGCILCMENKDQTLNDLTVMGLDNLKRLGTMPGSAAGFPIIRWSAAEAESSEPLHLLEVPYRALRSRPQFLLIENIQSLLPSGNTNNEKEVAVFLDRLRRFCDENDVTVLGTVGTPKATKGYSHCQRIKGTGLWSEGIDTLISLEEVRAAAANGLTQGEASLYRRLTIIPPGQPRKTQWVRFNVVDGRLLTCAAPQPSGSMGMQMLYRLLSLEEVGKRFTRRDLHAWGMRAGVGEHTVDRWSSECIKGGQLRKEGYAATTVYTKMMEN